MRFSVLEKSTLVALITTGRKRGILVTITRFSAHQREGKVAVFKELIYALLYCVPGEVRYEC